MATLEGKNILYFEDVPIPVYPDASPKDTSLWDSQGNAIGKNWNGMYRRVIHFEDGVTKTYKYDARIPENQSGDENVIIPKGAVLEDQSVDKDQQAIYNQQKSQAFAEQRAKVQDNAQISQEAGNVASQTGYVQRSDENGNIVQQTDENGNPIKTVAREQLDISKAQLDRQTNAQEASNTIQQEQNQIAKDRNAAEALYREKQLEAEKERDRLNGLVSIGKLQADVAHNQFLEWLETNVKAPFQAMEEARNRAAEVRQAQALEDARRQNAAIHTQNNEKMAMDFGNRAMDAAVSTLPYMAGPNFGSQMAGAINAIGKGRPQDIKFDASGLTFDSPDFAAIAEQATARALSHLSPYAASIAQAGDRPGGGYATGDYTGIPMPNMASAPNTGPSTITALNQLGYTPGGGSGQPAPVPAPVPAPSAPPEEWH